MSGRDAFSACHPAVNLAYFTLILLFGMCWMHPVCLAISLAGATACVFSLGGKRTMFGLPGVLLPMALLAQMVRTSGGTYTDMLKQVAARASITVD